MVLVQIGIPVSINQEPFPLLIIETIRFNHPNQARTFAYFLREKKGTSEEQ
jgi:hypothetical protein